MTDQNIPADEVQLVIEEMTAELRTSANNNEWEDGYNKATSLHKARLEALLPKPRTLADELRGIIRDSEEGRMDASPDGGVRWWEADLFTDLRYIADRVETLEQEHDAAQAEIARLRACEIPNGWRVADHPDHGTVIADPKEYLDGYVMIRYLNENQFGESRPVPSRILSFRDEAPAPEETPRPEHIDPTTCGTRQWYNVRLKSDGIIYDAVRINGEGMIRPWLILGDQYRAASDTDLTVLRPLTSEEMDAR